MADEAYKWERLAANPEIQDAVHQLEDDALVRGRIMAFDLDPAKLSSRAKAFAAVSDPEPRDLLGAALLTKGDYSRDVGWGGRKRQLGSSKKGDSWTDLLTTGTRANLDNIRGPLMRLLDDFAQRSADSPETSVTDVLREVRDAWLAERDPATSTTGATTSCATRVPGVQRATATTTANTTPRQDSTTGSCGSCMAITMARHTPTH